MENREFCQAYGRMHALGYFWVLDFCPKHMRGGFPTIFPKVRIYQSLAHHQLKGRFDTSKHVNMDWLLLHLSLVICIFSNLCFKNVLPLLNPLAANRHDYYLSYPCLPEEDGIMRCITHSCSDVDNLAWGQARDKQGGVDKPLFWLFFRPYFTLLYFNLCFILASKG